MKREEAYRILGVPSGADRETVKRSFRRLMARYHPDAAGEALPENVRQAQRINEAYSLLRGLMQDAGREDSRREGTGSAGASGEDARGRDTSGSRARQPEPVPVDVRMYTERNIYLANGFEEWERTRSTVLARGKYLWDPDREDFSLLLRSLNHAALELLEEAERKKEIYEDNFPGLQQLRFPYQMEIFHALARQCIRPVFCLQKLAEPVERDRKGRAVYRFRAYLGGRGIFLPAKILSDLKPGKQIYPVSFEGNRILMEDGQKRSLGHLSLESDCLYYVVIPLLKSRKAQMKCLLAEGGGLKADLFLRLEDPTEEDNMEKESARTGEILKRYAEKL